MTFFKVNESVLSLLLSHLKRPLDGVILERARQKVREGDMSPELFQAMQAKIN